MTWELRQLRTMQTLLDYNRDLLRRRMGAVDPEEATRPLATLSFTRTPKADDLDIPPFLLRSA